MKKAFLFTLAILTVLSMVFALPASPAAAKGGEKSITLLSAQYIPGKGVTFKFAVQGDFADFAGSVMINGQEFALNCVLNDDGDLVCTASQGLKSFIGQNATIIVNGYYFGARVRDGKYCYPIFDYAYDYVNMDWLRNTWEQAGTQCQDTPANVGDSIEWYNIDGYWDYFYSLDGQDLNTTPPDMGPGYYYNFILN